MRRQHARETLQRLSPPRPSDADAPRDVWIAGGSDGKADLWIDNVPVWISGDQLEAWRINEGYRKVHLRQGRNKVLYRRLSLGFSLALHAKAE